MSDEWELAGLDLDAYLERVGFEGRREPSAETLRALHLAHRAAIPFENLDVVIGRGVDVSLPAVEDKLVGRRRGGYCFEHGVLFGAVLERFGFAVDRYLARVGSADGDVRPRTHMSLHVRLDDGGWLADVGFGGGLLEPLPWSDGSRARQGRWTYELARIGERHWELREETPAARQALYHFIAEPQHSIDVVVANHYISTHPSSVRRQARRHAQESAGTAPSGGADVHGDPTRRTGTETGSARRGAGEGAARRHRSAAQ